MYFTIYEAFTEMIQRSKQWNSQKLTMKIFIFLLDSKRICKVDCATHRLLFVYHACTLQLADNKKQPHRLRATVPPKSWNCIILMKTKTRLDAHLCSQHNNRATLLFSCGKTARKLPLNYVELQFISPTPFTLLNFIFFLRHQFPSLFAPYLKL